jgi:hypothetical protein
MDVSPVGMERSAPEAVWPPGFLDPDAVLDLHLLKGFVTDDLMSMEDVRTTLAAVGPLSQVGPNLRVAVDGGYRQDVRQKLIDSEPPDGNRWLEHWAEGLFGDQPFYVVVNELEVFNPVLVRRIARLLWPLVEAHSGWFGGLSMALLMGRDGYTSFGVHRDPDCRWNLQFHVGPSSKTTLVWADGTLDDSTSAERLAVDPLLPKAAAFELAPGDLFVLPCRRMHAARYDDLAVTLVASMKVESERSLAEAAFHRLLDANGDRKGAGPLPLGRSLLGANPMLDPGLDGEGLASAMESERLRRWSNLGMIARKAGRLPAIPEILGLTFVISDPFPVCARVLADGRRWIAARGHTLTLAGDDDVDSLVERLNAGERVRAGGDLAPRALLLLAFLIGHQAVHEAGTERVSGSEP